MTMAKTRILIFIIAVFGTTVLHAQQAVDAVPASVKTEANYGGAAAVLEPETDATPLTLLVGRSTVVDVGASPITRVSLTSAEVADAMVTSPSQLLVHGKVPGSISMFVWNRDGAIHR